MGARNKYVVFLGPTLSAGEAEQTLDAIYVPPAVQGSIVEATYHYEPSVILIIDGSFQGEPAVRHKEILWAISRGIPVVGAASMGALRAAELFPHMHGVGLIYRWYRRFAFAPDDAVAVLHGPPEVNCAALTLAEVDLRMTFRAAERKAALPRAQRKELERICRKLNFRDRTLERVASEAAAHASQRTSAEWLSILKSSLVEQKKRDALQALRMLKDGAFAARPRPVNFVMTSAFARDLEHSGISLDALR